MLNFTKGEKYIFIVIEFIWSSLVIRIISYSNWINWILRIVVTLQLCQKFQCIIFWHEKFSKRLLQIFSGYFFHEINYEW